MHPQKHSPHPGKADDRLQYVQRLPAGFYLSDFGGMFSLVLHRKTNVAGMELVTVKPGKFLMGSAGYGENYDEKPAHAVRISMPFRMSATEVTNKQYELFDPGHHTWRGKRGFSSGDDEAVVFVSYYEAAAFCKWLSQKEGKTYRLPTEAEWSMPAVQEHLQTLQRARNCRKDTRRTRKRCGHLNRFQ